MATSKGNLLASKHTSIASPPGYVADEDVTLLLSAGIGIDCAVGGAGGAGILLSLSKSTISIGASVDPSTSLSTLGGGVDVLLVKPSAGVAVPTMTMKDVVKGDLGNLMK